MNQTVVDMVIWASAIFNLKDAQYLLKQNTVCVNTIQRKYWGTAEVSCKTNVILKTK